MTGPRPARGTRPANRRELVVAAATELFATHGFERVSVADVAEAVAVGPSALYRHFRGKEALLAAVIGAAGDALLAATEVARPTLAETIDALTATALDHRSLGVLLQREARHLDPASHGHLDEAVDEVRRRLARQIADLRPGTDPDQSAVLAHAVLGVLLSPSFHHVTVERPRFDQLLSEAALRVLAQPTPPAPASPEPVAARRFGRTVRREVVLAAALDLFAEATFASVSMDEVATAAGMATSSVYLHFPSKVDLLSIALDRGNGFLQLSLDRTLREAPDEVTALHALVASYCTFAFSHPAVVDLLITETRTLPAAEGVALTQAQRDYVHEWVHLHRSLHPELSEPESTVVVQSALMLMNDLARLPALRSRPDAEQVVAALATAVLDPTSPEETLGAP